MSLIVLLIAAHIGGEVPGGGDGLTDADHKTAVQLVVIDLVLGEVAAMDAIAAGVLDAGWDDIGDIEDIAVTRHLSLQI